MPAVGTWSSGGAGGESGSPVSATARTGGSRRAPLPAGRGSRTGGWHPAVLPATLGTAGAARHSGDRSVLSRAVGMMLVAVGVGMVWGGWAFPRGGLGAPRTVADVGLPR